MIHALKREDIQIGSSFGSWIVLEKAENHISGKNSHVQRQWLCQCICGFQRVFTSHRLKKESKSCCHIWGKRFGKLVVKEPALRPEGNKTGTFVKCICDCGNEYICNKRSLLVGDAKSCGCSRTRLDDLTGKRFGALQVLDRAENKNQNVFWNCKCDCGNYITLPSASLKKGKKSCGCIKVLPSNFRNLTNQRFGHLQVLRMSEHIYSGKQSKITWECVCDCGNKVIVRGDALKSGSLISCGCFANNKKDLFLDFSGFRFDQLQVLGPYENRKSLWLCRCDCGNTIVKTRKQLLTSKINSCGCKGEQNISGIDIGSVFGNLVIVDQLESKEEKLQWLCKCSCGKHRVFTTYDLTSGLYTDCGHVLEEKRNLAGLKFGRLTVLKKIQSDSTQSRWLCECECGNTKEVYGSHLKVGNVQSCGCLARELTSERSLEDLSGRRFGLWTVMERVEKPEHRKQGTFWRCVCDCGQEGIVAASELKYNKSRSCGCNNRSKYEMWTEDALKMLNYEYSSQVTFENLTGVGYGKLSFDYAVYLKDNLIALIECQGLQHYEPVEHFGGVAQFERQKKHDALKRDYATNKLSIPLIEIPYWVNDIQSIMEIIKEAIE